MFREGQQIGLYTLIRKLGRGGFGEVWLAERRAKFVTTKVAVTLPHDDQIDHEAVKQEATLWEQASGHPNILPIIDADECDGQIVIVSEYAPDGSLEQWLKTHGKMSPEKAIETTIQILDGLEFLHSRNIIHRDLKPANILLQGNTPRLADFGISRALRTTVASQSQNISGTFAYMSPEALDGKRSIQTDVWSVGVNLYQFLTGTLPFPQKEPSALLAAIMMREFEPLPADVPQSLKNVVAKALAKQPENRYASAGAMREDLRRIWKGETISDFMQSDLPKTEILPISAISPTQKSLPISAQNLQDETKTIFHPLETFGQNEKNKSYDVWMFATLGLILVGAISLGIYFLTNQSKQPDSNKNHDKQSIEIQSNKNTASNKLTDVSVNTKATNVNAVSITAELTPSTNIIQCEIKSLNGAIAMGVNIDGKRTSIIVPSNSLQSFQAAQSLKLAYSKLKAKDLQMRLNGKLINLPTAPSSNRNVIEFEITKENINEILQSGKVNVL
ncbi:MAG: serine/threonine protein kinase [Pyrinomonadaceae bacterium]|nr:serine/threonine protein kinase [Pyrinomonadaceae bacterium]